MSVLDYVDVGVYLYQKAKDGTEKRWIIKDIRRKELLIECDSKTYKMTDKELEALYRKREVRISRKGE